MLLLYSMYCCNYLVIIGQFRVSTGVAHFRLRFLQYTATHKLQLTLTCNIKGGGEKHIILAIAGKIFEIHCYLAFVSYIQIYFIRRLKCWQLCKLLWTSSYLLKKALTSRHLIDR